MEKKGATRKMFPGGNTAKGFHSFFYYITGHNYTRRYIIKGGPGAGKSTFMSGIGEYMLELGFDVNEYPCPTDPDSLDAISIPELGIALMDGTAPHVVEPKNPGITDDIIWLGQFWDSQKLGDSKGEIMALNKKAERLFKTAFSHLKEALVAYDEWRSYARDDLNRGKYNLVLRKIIGDIFTGIQDIADEKIVTHKHFFASAISGKGIYNYTKSIIRPFYKVYALSGMPGAGSKTAIQRIAMEAQERGFSTEQFHCPIDVDELDLLIIPELNIGVVNIDQVLDSNSTFVDYSQIEMYINFDDCLNHEIVRDFAEDMKDAENRFRQLVERTINVIFKAKSTHGRIENYYVSAMDFEGVNKKQQDILGEILGLIGK